MVEVKVTDVVRVVGMVPPHPRSFPTFQPPPGLTADEEHALFREQFPDGLDMARRRFLAEYLEKHLRSRLESWKHELLTPSVEEQIVADVRGVLRSYVAEGYLPVELQFANVEFQHDGMGSVAINLPSDLLDWFRGVDP